MAHKKPVDVLKNRLTTTLETARLLQTELEARLQSGNVTAKDLTRFEQLIVARLEGHTLALQVARFERPPLKRVARLSPPPALPGGEDDGRRKIREAIMKARGLAPIDVPIPTE